MRRGTSVGDLWDSKISHLGQADDQIQARISHLKDSDAETAIQVSTLENRIAALEQVEKNENTGPGVIIDGGNAGGS